MVKKEKRELSYKNVVGSEKLNELLSELEQEYKKNQMIFMRAVKDKKRFENEYELQSKKSSEWEIISEIANKDENKILFLEGMKRKEEYKILSIKYKKEIYKQEKIIKMIEIKLQKVLNEIDKLKIRLNII